MAGSMELLSLEDRAMDTDDSNSEVDSESKVLRDKIAVKKSGQGVSLKKELTLFTSVAYVVGSIIGAGIFITPRTILCLAGSFGVSLVMWVIGGVIALGGGLCYIELGLLIKRSGGEYSYLKEAYSFRKTYKVFEFLGSLLSFLFIWSSMLIIRTTSLSLITLTCARYLVRPFYIGCDQISEPAVKLLAVAVLLTLSLMNCYSVKLSSKLMSILTVSKVFAVLFIVVLGIAFIIKRGTFPDSFVDPFGVKLPGHEPSFSQFSLSLYGIVWAYNGWNVIGYANEEMKNVKKTLPLSLLIGVPIVTACYLLANVSFFAILTYDDILSAQTVALSFGDSTIGNAGVVIICLLVSVSAFGSANGSLFASTRVIFVAAREGHLPDFLSGLHVTARTPVPAIIMQALLAMIMAAVGSIDQLIKVYGFISLLTYGMVITGVLILRVTHRHEPRLFKSWFIVPVASFMAFLCAILVIAPLFMDPIHPLIAFAFVLLGVPVYIFLAMDSPWKFRPAIAEKLSGYIAVIVNNALNTQSTRHSYLSPT